MKPGKLLTAAEMTQERYELYTRGKRLVFTNGCFDMLHPGHLNFLRRSRKLGHALVVGLNSDASVRRLKGSSRPIFNQEYRACMLRALRYVDYVVIFEEDEPRDLIIKLLPDILTKSDKWAHHISGKDVVEISGGKVVVLPSIAGISSSTIIEAIKHDNSN